MGDNSYLRETLSYVQFAVTIHTQNIIFTVYGTKTETCLCQGYTHGHYQSHTALSYADYRIELPSITPKGKMLVSNKQIHKHEPFHYSNSLPITNEPATPSVELINLL